MSAAAAASNWLDGMTTDLTRRRLLLGSASLISAPAAAQPLSVIRIAATGSVRGGKPQVGGAGPSGRVMREGWLAAQLKQRGIGLEWFPVAGDTGPVINEAFAAGRIQFANYGDLPSLILNAAGIHTRMVLPVGRGQDVFLLVPKGSQARSLADLRGKRISLHRSRPWEMGFYKLARQSGFSRSDFRIVNMDPHAGVAALASGQVDALFSNNGFSYQIRGAGKIIWSSQKDFDKKMRAALWTSSAFLDAHPDIVQLVVTAYLRAQYYYSQDAHREEAVQEGTRNGTPIEAVRQTYGGNAIAWKDYWTPLYDGLVWSQYRQSAAFVFDNHIIGRRISAESLLEPRFQKAALATLHLESYWRPWTGTAPPA
jgi:sulfonate transport system substrate-binding protein